MGIGSDAVNNWGVVTLSFKNCDKKGSSMTNLIISLVFFKSSLSDNIIKICASGRWFLFILQGIFSEGEQHPISTESSANVGS
jgi:hypothetical protein